MSHIDVIKTAMATWSRADWDTFSALLTDDFHMIAADDPTASPVDKTTFLGWGQAVLIAFPNWAFNPQLFREEGDTVSVTVEITGTHTGTLAAIPDVPPVPATGKRIRLPAEDHVYTIRGGQVSRLAITFARGGGFEAMYAQIGAPLSE